MTAEMMTEEEYYADLETLDVGVREYWDALLGRWVPMSSIKDRQNTPEHPCAPPKLLPKVPEFEFPTEEPLVTFEHMGHKFSLLPDLRLYYTTQGAVSAVVPCEEDVIRRRIYGSGAAYSTLEPKLLSWDKSLLPPPSIIRYWRDRLASACSGEAYLSIARKRIPDANRVTYRWLGIVPKQEATAGGVDVDDLEPAFAKAVELGYEPCGGTLHLHPAGMLGASGTDIEDYSSTPSLYIIAPRSTAACSVWVSAGGATFNVRESHPVGEMRKHTAATPLRIPKRCRLIGVDGRTSKIDELIERPAPLSQHSHQTWYGGSKSKSRTSKSKSKRRKGGASNIFTEGYSRNPTADSTAFLASLADAIRYAPHPEDKRIIVIRSAGARLSTERVVPTEVALRLEAQYPEMVTVVELSGDHLMASVEDFIEHSGGA